VYALNVKYSPYKNLGLRASYGKGFRAPALKELYLEFVDLNHHVSGNSNLKAEHSDNFNLSANAVVLNRKNHTLGCDATFFYNIIYNKIDFKYDISNPTWAQYFNIDEGPYKAMGADVKLRYKLHPRFNFNMGVNHLIRSQVADLNAYYRSTDYSADFDYKNLKYQFRISLFYKYTDDWYTTKSYFDKNNQQGRVEDGYMEGFHTLDVTLSRPFLKNSLEIFVGAKNIFDNTNVNSYGSKGNVHSGGNSGESPVGWGRTFFIRLSYNFIKY
jgi:outer membrane receptor for ferrienterochelin and colicins